MTDNMTFLIIGGLGFFFFGMQIMSEGLKKVAGDKLKYFLHSVTKLPIMGVLVGTFVTCLIQSSSATTVMTVGFVNAGLLGLKQAIPVIMGANIGTTFTAWLVSSMSVFKVTSYALPAVGIGFALMSLTRRRKTQSWGQVLLGFGLLFIGLYFMKNAFGPLKSSQFLKDVFISFSDYPLLGVLAGIVFTVLLQSSSATIAIVQILAFNGVISFEAALPLILGDNIGTTITAQMAAVGTNLNARRVAMSHTVFNVLGVSYMLIFVQSGIFVRIVDAIIPGAITTTNIMFHIAVAHSAFNVINCLVFLPAISFLEKVSIWLVPQKEDIEDMGTQYLEKHLLETPSLALEQVCNELTYMLKIARKAVTQAMASFMEDDFKKIKKTAELETVTDNLQSEITQYIIQLSQHELTKEESEELPVLIHNVNDVERIGDHAQNLSELARRKIEDALKFTPEALAEIQIMWQELEGMMEDTVTALRDNDVEVAQKVIEREEKINSLQEQLKQAHIHRSHKGKCHLNSGFIFLEFIDNLEKVGDRLTNVAQSVLGKMRWQGQAQEVV